MFACSHDIGGRLLSNPSGDFPLLCLDDGYGIINPRPPLNGEFYNRVKVSQEVDVASENWSPATMGSFINRNTANPGFILAYLTKYRQLYYQIKFIIFDGKMQQTVKLDYTLEGSLTPLTSIEHYHLHLMPYGAKGSDEYLLYYTTTVMDTIWCCSPKVKESRCFGKIENKFYQHVTFKDNKYAALSAPVSFNMSMTAEATPQYYPNGDMIWAVVDNTMFPFLHDHKKSITFNRVKNCNN